MGEAAAPDDDVSRHLVHLKVERRLAERTLVMYGEAFDRLRGFVAEQGVVLRAVQVHHVRRWAAKLHAQGLAPRSIAIVLSAWRGLFRWLGREGSVVTHAQPCGALGRGYRPQRRVDQRLGHQPLPGPGAHAQGGVEAVALQVHELR